VVKDTKANIPSSSLDSTEEVEGTIGDITSSTRSQQARLKKICLKRDDFRCLVDRDIVETDAAMDGLTTLLPNDTHGDTELAHILPFQLRKFEAKNDVEVRFSC
jgi:hypothetical protein